MVQIRAWLSNTDTPRWLIAAGFAVSTATSVVIGKYTDNTKRVDDNRTQQIRALQDSMVQFQIMTSAISSEMFDKKKVSDEAKNNLIKNLNEQFARAKMVETLIPSEDRTQINDYKYAIGKMIDATRQISTLTELSDFWGAASKLLVARNKVNAKLNAFI